MAIMITKTLFYLFTAVALVFTAIAVGTFVDYEFFAPGGFGVIWAWVPRSMNPFVSGSQVQREIIEWVEATYVATYIACAGAFSYLAMMTSPYLSDRVRRIVVLLVPLATLELGILGWGLLYEFNLFRTVNIIRVFYQPYNQGIGSLTQDETFFILIAAVVVASLYEFRFKFVRVVQTVSLALIPLPATIYVVDRSAWDVHFVSVIAGTAPWITNQVLFYACIGAFASVTIFEHLTDVFRRLVR
jgi:hypothetical protein